MKTRCRRYTIAGQVQGVGFRPFVYRLAMRFGIIGTVSNTSEGVCIHAQGTLAILDSFDYALKHELPPLARITHLHWDYVHSVDNADGGTSESDGSSEELLSTESGFRIVASTGQHGHHVLISPDMATCPDCLDDMRDPLNARHNYAFTNCTNCGPRYTITRSIPYDRATTSMACFPLCPSCEAEYENPLDRRFHAQPNACPVCGPKLWRVDLRGGQEGECHTDYGHADGHTAPQTAPHADGCTDYGHAHERNQDAMRAIISDIVQGKLAAIKGLGGFHLACDATNEDAVQTLRQRKSRPHKPLAIMVPDMETVRRLACPTEEEEALLLSQERPIVLCRARASHEHDNGNGASQLASQLAPQLAPSIAPYSGPDTPHIGIMLPYTPLHHVLFHYLQDELSHSQTEPLCALVMTSGNAGGEPICLGNREAMRRLAHIADTALLHNRDILIRTDDSVLRHIPEHGTLFMRRARGFVPQPSALALYKDKACVLGTGPELKNTLCLSRHDMAFVSQHIGNMHNLETFGFFQEIAAHLMDILQVKPQLLVCDLHPDFMASQWAHDYGKENKVPVVTLQHHYAHAHAVLAEHQYKEAAICLVLDGTGYGEDSTIWGGECLLVNPTTLEHRRLGHLQSIPLAGGEAAIREPWRIAHAMLHKLGLHDDASTTRALPWSADFAQASTFVTHMVKRGINTPLTSSCGRLFDAVAAMLGLCNTISYEGQAAIILEQVQDLSATGAYACPYDIIIENEAKTTVLDTGGKTALLDISAKHTLLDTDTLFRQVHADWLAHVPTGIIARRFHLGLVEGLVSMAAFWSQELGIQTIGLSGGVMQNATLAEALPKALRRRGLVPLCHSQLPPNDGSVSFGQAAYGNALLVKETTPSA